MSDKVKEIISALAVIIVAIIIMDPAGFYYNQMTIASLIVVLLLAFVAFQIFVWKNKPRDEREVNHEMIASRVGYLIGTALLVVGIAFQSIVHDVDLWLVITLLVMIVGKISACIYSQRYN